MKKSRKSSNLLVSKKLYSHYQNFSINEVPLLRQRQPLKLRLGKFALQPHRRAARLNMAKNLHKKNPQLILSRLKFQTTILYLTLNKKKNRCQTLSKKQVTVLFLYLRIKKKNRYLRCIRIMRKKKNRKMKMDNFKLKIKLTRTLLMSQAKLTLKLINTSLMRILILITKALKVKTLARRKIAR